MLIRCPTCLSAYDLPAELLTGRGLDPALRPVPQHLDRRRRRVRAGRSPRPGSAMMVLKSWRKHGRRGAARCPHAPARTAPDGKPRRGHVGRASAMLAGCGRRVMVARRHGRDRPEGSRGPPLPAERRPVRGDRPAGEPARPGPRRHARNAERPRVAPGADPARQDQQPAPRNHAVPALRIAVRDKAHNELYSWTAPAPKTKLDAGETIVFRSRLAAPPEDGQDLMVSFADSARRRGCIRSLDERSSTYQGSCSTKGRSRTVRGPSPRRSRPKSRKPCWSSRSSRARSCSRPILLRALHHAGLAPQVEFMHLSSYGAGNHVLGHGSRS